MNPLLVLDIDETLISYKYVNNIEVPIPRPFLKEFLQYCHGQFQLAIWTAANETWFTQVHDQILVPIFEELNIQSPFLFIYHTDMHDNMTKPLRKVWAQFPLYNEDNTIMVDDRIGVFQHNMKNGIRISPFYANPHDEVLLYMINLMKEYKLYYDENNKFPGLRIIRNPRIESR